MAKIKLNQLKRSKLMSHARKVVVFEEEQAAETTAFNRLRAAVVAQVGFHATPLEMATLAKFGATRLVGQVRFREPDNGNTSFCLCPRDVHESPSERNGWCHNERRVIPEEAKLVVAPTLTGYNGKICFDEDVEDVLRPLLDEWTDALKAHNEARSSAMNDLFSLFRQKHTLEAVVEAWPPAGDISEELGFIPAPTPESLDRIKGLKARKLAPAA